MSATNNIQNAQLERFEKMDDTFFKDFLKRATQVMIDATEARRGKGILLLDAIPQAEMLRKEINGMHEIALKYKISIDSSELAKAADSFLGILEIMRTIVLNILTTPDYLKTEEQLRDVSHTFDYTLKKLEEAHDKLRITLEKAERTALIETRRAA